MCAFDIFCCILSILRLHDSEFLDNNDDDDGDGGDDDDDDVRRIFKGLKGNPARKT
ncbi:hypothetical protein BofuT4_uP144290.1 [Botrytis cinerea T4]|uniref:Uncharacterized protein n=1 Tax=Botryotinia fuckeliana (strain T4) TaxID=999810 RepID=G2YYC3_BOTF4|nr:hypothetical protein BofuT4_uP144290.1 [Botrytis cinerea T4]